MALRDRAAELPATANVTYLNTGAAGPLLARAAAAMNGQLAAELAEGRAGRLAWERFLAGRQRLRDGLGWLAGAAPDEIVLTHHTTEGLNIALWGLDWQPGDRLLVTSLEHPAVAAAVAAVARRQKLAVEVLECGTGERETVLAALAAALHREARLLVTSHVSWSTGAVLPVAEMTALAHAASAAVLVDGAQAVGATDVNVTALGADFYAFSGYKWLCGPEGTGALVVRRAWHDRLAPSFGGAFGVDEATLDLRRLDEVRPAAGAARYESGSWSRPNLAGLGETVAYHHDRSGSGPLSQDVAVTSQYCAEQLSSELGATVHTPAGQVAGLVSFSLPDADPRTLARELERSGVIIRSIPGTDYLRVSCAFFTTTSDIDILIATTAALTGQRSPS